jgi:hypothetical protein
MRPKLPIWLRIVSLVLAVPPFLVTRASLFMAYCTLGHTSPAGPTTAPYTVGEILEGIGYLLVPFYGLFFVWLALGAPGLFSRKHNPNEPA